MGRPSLYTPELGDSICERLAEGESLRTICDADDMPSRATVFRWCANDAVFCNQYAHAREEQAETHADEIVSIADEKCTTVRADKHGARADDDEGNVEVVFDSAAVARNRLRVDARKWVASKLKPKKYGDRQVLAGDPDAPLGKSEDEVTTKLMTLLAPYLSKPE